MSNVLKITIKYTTKCKHCLEWIIEGQQAYFEPESSDYFKLTCLPCYNEQGEDLEVSEAKKRLSTSDLSTPTQDCHNEECNQLTSPRAYFCSNCWNKLPQDLKNKINCTYDQLIKTRKTPRSIADLAKVHTECLPFLNQ